MKVGRPVHLDVHTLPAGCGDLVSAVVFTFGGVDVKRKDIQGLYCYQGRFNIWQSYLGGTFHETYAPAGCVGIWKQKDPLTTVPFLLFLWFDGYEYQAIIAWQGDGPEYFQTLYSSYGEIMTCVSGVSLAGTLRMGIYGNVVTGVDDDTHGVDTKFEISFDGCGACIAGCDSLLGHVQDHDPVYFGGETVYAARDYTITYMNGAVAVQGGDGTGHLDPVHAGDPLLQSGVAGYNLYSDAGVITRAPNAGGSTYVTQAEVEAADGGTSVTFTLSVASKLWIQFDDSDFTDNWTEAGGHAPVWCLAPVPP